MKKRIKIDSMILSSIIVLTGLIYGFPQFYATSAGLDNLLDFLGTILILKGTYLRMAARGHKKAHSRQGTGLVTSGLYQYTRNPMYLGSFLIGAGFVLTLWPWWGLPIFAGLFYLRFRKQIVKEERHLQKLFGNQYETYCRRVPRIFPSGKGLWDLDVPKVFPWSEVWSTKERWGLLTWPLLAMLLETFQQMVVFKAVYVGQTILTGVLAGAIFVLVLAWHYRRKGRDG